jgi:hypothetical protein
MTFDSAAPLAALRTLVAGAMSNETVYVGVPESGASRLIAYLTLGGQKPQDFAAGRCLIRPMRYRITLAYALDGNEQAAEEALGPVLDALTLALFAARDTKLGGTVDSMEEPDLSGADEPRYQMFAGSEYREYPIVVTVSQQSLY